jgi:hypothetical protein
MYFTRTESLHRRSLPLTSFVTSLHYQSLPESKWRLAARMTACSVLALAFSAAHAQTGYCEPNSPGDDTTATYCTQPNFPTYGTPTQPLPKNSRAVPGDGLQLRTSATHLFSLVMGSEQPHANIRTGESVRDMFYMN